MKAWEVLGATSAPDGSDIRLTRRGDEYVMLIVPEDRGAKRRRSSA
jgi:hypothetical protein